MRIINILMNLEKNNLLKVVFTSNEHERSELVRIYANYINKEKVFKIISESVKKRSCVRYLSLQMQEIYKMHKTLTREDINHQIKYNAGRIFQSAVIGDIDSYFVYGANRVRNIYGSSLWESNNGMNSESYNYRFRDKGSMLNKMKQINDELDKEFKWQANEFEALSKKYRHNEEDADMFVRLAKVRDEYAP